MEFTSTIPKPFSWIGKLIKIKSTHKRIWGEVVNETDGEEMWDDEITPSPKKTLTIKYVYRPAPKSRLNNHWRPFTKFKKKIIPLNPIKTS